MAAAASASRAGGVGKRVGLIAGAVVAIGAVGVGVAVAIGQSSDGGSASAGEAADLISKAAAAAASADSYAYEMTTSYAIKAAGAELSGGWHFAGERAGGRDHVVAEPQGAEKDLLSALAGMGGGMDGDPGGGVEVVAADGVTYTRFSGGGWTTDESGVVQGSDVDSVIDVLELCEPLAVKSVHSGTSIDCRIPFNEQTLAAFGQSDTGADPADLGGAEARMVVVVDGKNRLASVEVNAAGEVPEGSFSFTSDVATSQWGEPITIDVPSAGF